MEDRDPNRERLAKIYSGKQTQLVRDSSYYWFSPMFICQSRWISPTFGDMAQIFFFLINWQNCEGWAFLIFIEQCIQQIDHLFSHIFSIPDKHKWHHIIFRKRCRIHTGKFPTRRQSSGHRTLLGWRGHINRDRRRHMVSAGHQCDTTTRTDRWDYESVCCRFCFPSFCSGMGTCCDLA